MKLTDIIRSLPHLVLCGTSGWALSRLGFDKYPFIYASTGFLLAHGILGTIRNTYYASWMDEAYSQSRILATTLPTIAFDSHSSFVILRAFIGQCHTLMDPSVLDVYWMDVSSNILQRFCLQLVNYIEMDFMLQVVSRHLIRIPSDEVHALGLSCFVAFSTRALLKM